MVYPYNKTDPTVLEVINGTTSIDSALFKLYSDAILRVENELGIKPSGTYSDVRSRLDAMGIGGRDGYAGATPNSVAIATHFRHNWLSPTITTPGGPVVLPTVLGRVSVDPYVEAGYLDGYGVSYFVSNFYVDSDASFTFQLWETTSTPTMLSSNVYTSGEQIVESIIVLPLAASLSRMYEIRCYQTASGDTINTNSIIWNSRFLFVPA